jgi:hypothetical protein
MPSIQQAMQLCNNCPSVQKSTSVEVYSRAAKQWVEATLIDCPSSDEISVAYTVDGKIYKKVMNMNSKHLRIANEYVSMDTELDKDWFQMFVRRSRHRRDASNDGDLTKDVDDIKKRTVNPSFAMSERTACPSSSSEDGSVSCDSSLDELPSEASCDSISRSSFSGLPTMTFNSCSQHSSDELSSLTYESLGGQSSFNAVAKTWRSCYSFGEDSFGGDEEENDLQAISFDSKYTELISHSADSVISFESPAGSMINNELISHSADSSFESHSRSIISTKPTLPPANVSSRCGGRWKMFWRRRQPKTAL